MAVGVSVLLGGLARVVTKFKATPDELSPCRFFTLEFLDLSCDILAYVFCFVEGDLEFADDGGLISISLLASVVASGVFFLMELFPVVHISRTIPRVESIAVMLTLGR